MKLSDIKKSVRNIPDFPKPGIQFKDITTAVKNPAVFHEMLAMLATNFQNRPIDYVVGIESRGFIFGAALAYALHCGFIPVRKPGKLPAKVVSQEYELEYGTDKLEIHSDAIEAGKHILIVDDLLATGGTCEAAAQLLKRLNGVVEGFAFAIELNGLNGRQKLEKYAPVYTLLRYDEA
ncbi:MAG: adenine phosphoribosyltransferase [Alphaproteobacteria bacterium]|nr:adenine phosphoribosyltransferase [Alphaproteobacteria bacterium]